MELKDLKEMICRYCDGVSHADTCDLVKDDCKVLQDFAQKLQQHIAKRVAEAKDEADSKWVAVLKRYNITVDSPESLAVAVDQLIAEAVKKEKGYETQV